MNNTTGLMLRLLRCYILSVFLYGVESWSLTEATAKKLETFVLWTYRRIFKIIITQKTWFKPSTQDYSEQQKTKLSFLEWFPSFGNGWMEQNTTRRRDCHIVLIFIRVLEKITIATQTGVVSWQEFYSVLIWRQNRRPFI